MEHGDLPQKRLSKAGSGAAALLSSSAQSPRGFGVPHVVALSTAMLMLLVVGVFAYKSIDDLVETGDAGRAEVQASARRTKSILLGGGSLAVATLGLLFAILRAEILRRREIERWLRASEQGLARLIDATPDPLFIVDQDRRILMANGELCALWGVEFANLRGKDARGLLLAEVPPDVQRQLDEIFSAKGVGQGKRPGIPINGRRPDGSVFPLELSMSWIDTPDGQLVIGTARDVTARKRFEQELRDAKETAEVAGAELEAFAYSVAHDLRSPLRAIDGFSLALLEDYEPQLDETGKEYVARVRAGAQRMALLIDDLLTLSRVTRVELSKENVDVSGLCHDVIGRLGRADPDRGGSIEIVIGEGIEAEADRRLLLVALENLLGNAWKFTSKKPKARIEVGASRSGGEMVYFVRDDGDGFEVKYINKLFKPFQRLHREDEFPGTGIGLATVLRVVRRHGGRIWADAAVGVGATFFFTLAPKAAAE